MRNGIACVLALALAACGGGDDKDGGTPVTVSGTVRAADGTPLAGAVVSVSVSTPNWARCGAPGPHSFSGAGTSDAQGNYSATAKVQGPWNSCPPFSVDVQVGSSCTADRSMPCYVQTAQATRLMQNDLASRAGIDLLAERRFRIFGSVAFPAGLAATDPREQPKAGITPPATGGQGGDVANGAFLFTLLVPGTYTVDFNDATRCVSFFFGGCNGAYTWAPGSVSVTIAASDVDVAFTATKK